MQVGLSTPGFQGSRNTGVVVTLYSLGHDPVLNNAPQSLEFTGRANNPGAAPAVTSVSTSKAMGAASGTFTVDLRVPPRSSAGDFLDTLVDDDWIDISWVVNGVEHHHMRGLVDAVRRKTQVSGQGASSRVYTITGRDFGKVFELTHAWFNTFQEENTVGDFTLKLFNGRNGTGQGPEETVSTILFSFLEIVTGSGHTSWRMPRGMKDAADTFVQTVKFSPVVAADPPRRSWSLQFANPNGGSIWDFAQEWSDPMFGELFCDLGYRGGGALDVDKPHPTRETAMTVFFRDKPFPTLELGQSSPWFSLPMVQVSRHALTSLDVGRAGAERVNAFILVPLSPSEQLKQLLTSPLWDTADIDRHGMRQMSVESRYYTDQDPLFLARALRTRVRDWHCLNAYFLSGSAAFGVLVPELRIGQRLRLVDTPDAQQTYYVEQVSHSWTPERGGRTSASLTRGWVGTDASYLDTLGKVAGRYTNPHDGQG